MGRKSDYHATLNKRDIDISFEITKQKFGVETMSVAEFATYISSLGETNIPTITEKTVRNYISKICSNSNRALNPDDFKNSDGEFELKPEYHRLLLTIIDSIYFDGRKKRKYLSNKLILEDQLLDNIEKYLSEEERETIKSTPAYPNALLDKQLTSHLETELHLLIHWLYHMDDLLRYKAMRDTILQLSTLRKSLCSADSMLTSARMVYAHDFDELQDAKYRRGLFESSALEQFIVQYLAAKVRNSDFQYLPDEVLSAPATAFAAKLFHLSTTNSELQQMINEIDTAVKNQEKYKDIMGRLSSVLDPADPIEQELLQSFESLVYIQFFRPELHPKDYQKTSRFLESCILENKYDLLNKFAQLGRTVYTTDQVEKILSAQAEKNQ